MKVQLISDVHGRFGKIKIADNADVIVAAGDIAERDEGVDWLISLKKPVIYVLGNHEYYGGEMSSVQESIRKACSGTNVTFLENDTLEMGDVRFIGTTLWSDFGNWSHPLVRACLKCMNDYRQISVSGWASDPARLRLLQMVKRQIGDNTPSNGLFHPVIASRMHKQAKRFLVQTLSDEWDGKNFVVTHHAPSYRSLRFAGYSSVVDPKTWTDDALARGAKLYKAGAYASNLEDIFSELRPDFWVHGHLHEGIEYPCHGARVSTNPLGYWDGQNPRWQEAFVIDTDKGVSSSLFDSLEFLLNKQRHLIDKIDQPLAPINFFSSVRTFINYGQTGEKFDEVTMKILSLIKENIPSNVFVPPDPPLFVEETFSKQKLSNFENVSGFERERIGRKIVSTMKQIHETFESWISVHKFSWISALGKIKLNRESK